MIEFHARITVSGGFTAEEKVRLAQYGNEVTTMQEEDQAVLIRAAQGKINMATEQDQRETFMEIESEILTESDIAALQSLMRRPDFIFVNLDAKNGNTNQIGVNYSVMELQNTRG